MLRATFIPTLVIALLPPADVAFGGTDTEVSYFVSGNVQAALSPNSVNPVQKPLGGSDKHTEVSGIAEPFNLSFRESVFAATSSHAEGFVHVVAYAEVAKLQVLYSGSFTSGNGKDEFASSGATAEVSASFHDAVRMFVPGVPDGTPVIFTSGFHLSGTLSATASSTPDNRHSSSASAVVTVAGNRYPPSAAPTISFFTALASDTSTQDPVLNLPPSYLPVTWAFKSGELYDFGFTLKVTGSGSALSCKQLACNAGGASASSSADYSQTLTWGGNASVINALTNEPITDWTLTSSSGFDYSKPYSVPEPSGAVLCITLCAWLGQARSRDLQS